MHGLLRKKKVWTLREILDSLKQVYCGKIGIEFMHIADREKCNWIRDKFEVEITNKLDKDHRIQLADRLLWTDGFAQFISQKFNTMKRFGLEGIESFIPGLKESIDALMDEGCEKVVMGMPHRGRLSVLANVIHKPLEQIFAEFQGVGPNTKEDEITGSGDVKYHLGTTYERERADGKKISVTLSANPSHLECVNPVVMGRARA